MNGSPLQQFLDSILIELDEVEKYVFCVLDSPPSDSSPWPPIDEAALHRRLRNHSAAYISTMISTTGRNRQQDFAALHMVVLDDVGTKATPPPATARPTYRIETSPGNEQWGYVLASPLRDRIKAEALVRAIYSTEHTDHGGRLVNKFVRLPTGINGKERERETDGTTFRDHHPQTLVHLDPDALYTPEQLLQAFNLPEHLLHEPPPTSTTSPTLNNPLARVQVKDGRLHLETDKVLAWLRSAGRVTKDSPATDSWVEVICPWAHLHSPGTGSTSGYSPLGRGDSPEHRGWKCLHDHCKDRKTVDFLEWVDEAGGPKAHVYDPIGLLSARHVLLEYSTEVADISSTAVNAYPVVSLSSFRAAHRQVLQGPRGGKQYHAELWLESEDTLRARGRTWRPGEPPLITEQNGTLLFNTYLPPKHPPIPPTEERIRPYIEHIDWLIPDPTERTLYHDWVARKLQLPASRSFALVMVADLRQGEQGHRYGTGRSTVGDILARIWQSGVAKLDLSDVTGNGNSQTAYTDWVDGSLLAVIEETKEEAANWRLDFASYEHLKKVVDTRPIPGVRVKPKYGKIYTSTLYANFLFFTNHSDAIQLPIDDRRVAVLDNAKGRRSFEEYAELKNFLDDDNAIAALYHWYMQRDISQHDHVYPPMTPAKQRMIYQSQHALDYLWERAMEILPGAVATARQIIQACNIAADGDEELMVKVPAMVRSRYRKLDPPPFLGQRTARGQFMYENRTTVTVRSIRDTSHLYDKVNQTSIMRTLSDELNLNKAVVNVI